MPKEESELQLLGIWPKDYIRATHLDLWGWDRAKRESGLSFRHLVELVVLAVEAACLCRHLVVRSKPGGLEAERAVGHGQDLWATACWVVAAAVLHSLWMGSGGSHHLAAEVASEGAAVMEEPVP